MQSHNPVLTRLRPINVGPNAGYLDPAAYAEPGAVAPVRAARMTLDDVVVRTVGLLMLLGLSGAVAWLAIPNTAAPGFAFGAAMVGLVLGLVIAIRQVSNPIAISVYAVVEGVFVGLISKIFEYRAPGIVLQAVMATFGIFLIMAALYKSRIIRATPKFTRGVLGALIGALVLMVVNLIANAFGASIGIRDGGAVAIIFSLVVIVIAALTFVVDFAQIEAGVAQGLPQRYAWNCAFGILLGLIWLYLEILRLISYFRE